MSCWLFNYCSSPLLSFIHIESSCLQVTDNHLHYSSYRNSEMRGSDECRVRAREDLRLSHLLHNEQWSALTTELSHWFPLIQGLIFLLLFLPLTTWALSCFLTCAAGGVDGEIVGLVKSNKLLGQKKKKKKDQSGGCDVPASSWKPSGASLLGEKIPGDPWDLGSGVALATLENSQ